MKFSALSLLSLVASAGAFAPSVGSPRPATFLDMARKPFISGNWKLNPQTRDEAVTLAKDIAASITDKSPDSDVALFVPYVFIEAVNGAIGDSKLNIGAEVRAFFLGDREPYVGEGFKIALTHVSFIGCLSRDPGCFHRRCFCFYASIYWRQLGPRRSLRTSSNFRRDG